MEIIEDLWEFIMVAEEALDGVENNDWKIVRL